MIGGIPIAQSGRVVVIAEAGVNHDGDLKKALALIDASHAAGADFVKFQCFSAAALVSADAPTCAYQSRQTSASQRDMLKRLELGREEFVALKAHADRAGIGFLATPFGLPEVALLVEMGLPALKIASPDIVNVPLLEAAVRTRLPIIASTGAADQPEIDAAVNRIRRQNAKYPLALLHCISAYPTALSDAHLARIRTLASRYQTPVGFSDHTVEVETGALAVAAGAVLLEKHVTLDRLDHGPDHFFSLTPPDLVRYISLARAASRAMGDGALAVTPHEREVRQLARGSIVAVRTIPAGSIVTPDMLAVQRPGTGLSAAEWERVVGRQAICDIPAHDRISLDSLR